MLLAFIMQQDRLTFPEAIRMLAKTVNVIVPEASGGNAQTTNARQLIYKVNALAVQFFHTNLISDKSAAANNARTYLKKRKIELKMVEQFQLGFAPNQWDGLISYLREKEINLKLMEKAGLIISRDNTQGYYDRFRNRIMFPILDTQGNCRAFGARAMESGDSGEKVTAKYINSPETNVYVKGHHLYGFDLAKQAIGQEDFVIIVEGICRLYYALSSRC